MPDLLPWIVICSAVALIGIAKSGFGGGLGLIVVPMTTLALPAVPGYRGDDALGLLLPLLMVGDVIAVSQYIRHAEWKLLRRMMAPTVVGIILGTSLIGLLKSNTAIAAALINIEIGFESLLLVSMTWYRQWRGTQNKLVREPLRVWATCTFAGTSSTLAHAAGPVIAMYLLPLNLGRQAMVATSATFFFFANIAKVPTYATADLFHNINPWLWVALFPLVLAGALFGKGLCLRMSDKVFSQVVYVTVFLLGGYLLAAGSIELIRHASS